MVSAPYGVAYGRIDDFVRSSRPWIDEHLAKVSVHTYADGDSVPFLGKNLSLVVQKGTIACCDIIDGKIVVTTPYEDIESIKAIIRMRYEKTVMAILQDRVPFWCSRLGLEVPRYGVNRAHSKWGVCYYREKRLYLSYMCAVLPYELIDMTVLHEVCHLVCPGHGQKFWALMKSFMPDLEERKTALSRIARSGWTMNIV